VRGRQTRRRGVVAALLALPLVLAACTVASTLPEVAPAASGPALEPAAAPADAAGLDVTGFVLEGADPRLVAASAASLDVVGVDGVLLADDGSGVGSGVGSPSDDALAQRDAAHDAGLTAQLLVSNFDEGLGDFSEAVAAGLLGSPDHRAAVVASLAADVADGGWDSVMIDLEGMSGDETAGLTAFAAELRAAVGPEVRLDVALQAATTSEGYADLGYDVPALAASLDHLTLMAYDQHGPWEADDPGPVGSLDWTAQAVEALTALAPADQVVLGVAGYGYRWGGDEPAGQVSDPAARDLAGTAVATWQADVGENAATLADGGVVWWSDARSLAVRVDLAQRLGLAGVAVWSLDLSDPVELAR